jgi:hypothetical protein
MPIGKIIAAFKIFFFAFLFALPNFLAPFSLFGFFLLLFLEMAHFTIRSHTANHSLHFRANPPTTQLSILIDLLEVGTAVERGV